MRVVAEAGTGEEALVFFNRLRPNVTLVDLRLPDLSGTDVIRGIRAQCPDCRVVVLTTYAGDEDIYLALEAGARAYLLKDAKRDELLSAIRAVHAGQRYIPPAIAHRLTDRFGSTELTGREREVLGLIVRGNSNKQIAWVLGVTEGTIKGHVNNILSKLGTSDRTHAAVTALRRGLVRLEENPCALSGGVESLNGLTGNVQRLDRARARDSIHYHRNVRLATDNVTLSRLAVLSPASVLDRAVPSSFLRRPHPRKAHPGFRKHRLLALCFASGHRYPQWDHNYCIRRARACGAGPTAGLDDGRYASCGES
jgi:DNA-binding NarL/FixJ family response regulator